MGESLLPDKDVEQGLLEVCEVWLNLQVFAYEMVRNTLLEVHADSKVEEEIRTYAPYSKKVKFFLDDVEKLLNLPTDDESLEVPLTPLLLGPQPLPSRTPCRVQMRMLQQAQAVRRRPGISPLGSRPGLCLVAG